MNRRRFLQQTALAAGACLAFPAVVRCAHPNSLLQVASVGVKNMGWIDVENIGAHPKVRFVGFCDVDKSRFDQADQKFPGVPHFADYRVMLSQLGDRVDAVSVATPDHMHAPVAMDAMRRKKHVYCQKPLTHTVWEARQMRLQAQKSRVITQLGSQCQTGREYRLAVRLLREGVIGKIHEVFSWIGNHGHQFTNRTERPAAAPVPSSLDWDLWIGGAPLRPYAENVYHPFNWRDWQDFGGGALGDFGCHVLSPVFRALDLTAPISVRADHGGINPETWPGPETVQYVFPGTALTTGSTVRVTWFDGNLRPPPDKSPLPADREWPIGGSLFLGQEGAMLVPHVATPELYPESKFEKFVMPKVEAGSHWGIWVDAILAGQPASDGFDFAGPLTEAVQLGNVAARRPGRDLLWNAGKLKITNDREANALLTKTYRKGWKVPAA